MNGVRDSANSMRARVLNEMAKRVRGLRARVTHRPGAR